MNDLEKEIVQLKKERDEAREELGDLRAIETFIKNIACQMIAWCEKFEKKWF